MPQAQTGYYPGVGGRLWWKSIDPETDAVPLILLHGGPGSPSDYLESLDVLGDERRVVVYDQLGCGRSDTPDAESLWRVETFVDALESLASDSGLETFHLFGHSWGGMLALAFYDKWPERVKSLVLASPLVSVQAWCADAARLIAELPPEHQAALAGSADTVEYQAALQEFYRRHFCRLDPWPPSLQRSVDGLAAAGYETMWGPNEFTQTGNLRGVDLTPIVRSLTIPNLWLCGSDDEATPETIRGFSHMNSYGDYVEFAGGTHNVHLEQPQAFVATLREFLRATD
ncbi:proline iminopeptidase-family hydrolase [Glaciibacter superstes]|uniref:proline iminopeptidase-family hydrolase n=1 Tax=Glaciibacter superstes TaxID=501023 RepID=UPI000479B28C|nr:proline iminopeptidase-family hydrolase [Glaciibacter superstes]